MIMMAMGNDYSNDFLFIGTGGKKSGTPLTPKTPGYTYTVKHAARRLGTRYGHAA